MLMGGGEEFEEIHTAQVSLNDRDCMEKDPGESDGAGSKVKNGISDDVTRGFQQYLEALQNLPFEANESAVPIPQEGSHGVSSRQSSSRQLSHPDRSEMIQELVFLQENVTIYPVASPFSQLSGCLCLDKRESLLFLSWIPYPVDDASEEEETFIQQQAKIFKDIPVLDFYSIRRFTPALGYHYVILALKSGLALPSLHFHSGGLKKFLSCLRVHVALTRSRETKDVYLVNSFRDPLKKSLSQLGLPEGMATSPALQKQKQKQRKNDPRPEEPLLPQEGPPPPFPAQASKEAGGGGGGGSGGGEGGEKAEEKKGKKKKKKMQPEDVAMEVLEGLSSLTAFARMGIRQVAAGLQVGGEGSGVDWANRRATSGALPGRAVREEVGGKGWSWGGGDKDKKEDGAQKPAGPTFTKQPPITAEEWELEILDSEGRLKNVDLFRSRVFFGGVEEAVKPEVWKFLFGRHSMDSTAAERMYREKDESDTYLSMRGDWLNVSEEEANQRPGFREQLNAVDKDVTRTDPQLPFYDGEDNENVNMLRNILITYSFYNPELGYCQGMCDFLSPILFVLRNESEAFWCFQAAMASWVGQNFRQDQTGMQVQLLLLEKLVELLDPELYQYLQDEDCLNFFFCFRWIFLQFKREFSFDNIVILWEKLRSQHLSPYMHLVMCVAILKQHKQEIIGEQVRTIFHQNLSWYHSANRKFI